MHEITVSAKTIDDAITEASIQLKTTSDMLEYEIIEKGSTGFLGIGIKQAVIVARKKEEEKISEKEVLATPPVPEEKAVQKREKKQSKAEKAEEKTAEIKTEHAEIKLAEVKAETKTVCEQFLKDVLEAMGMKVSIVSTTDKEGTLSFELVGDNMGILIGKRGQTLDSLQYLANRIANKQQEDYVRVRLDTENYRKRREDTLKNLAKSIAYKVKRTRKTVSLEPMNPYERRIIHSVLQADKNISTHSEGEEPYRRVVVTLAKK